MGYTSMRSVDTAWIRDERAGIGSPGTSTYTSVVSSLDTVLAAHLEQRASACIVSTRQCGARH